MNQVMWLQEVEQRRDTLINLARKHRCLETELPERHQALQAEYKRLEQAHTEPEKLQAELKELHSKYIEIAIKVSAKRQAVAAELSTAISEQMQDLGMSGGELSIQVIQNTDARARCVTASSIRTWH